MRWAVVADIHGNLLALEAVIRDIAARRLDHVVNLGDCVSGPLWPRETADRLRALGWPTVRGNHDRWVGEATTAPAWSSDVFAWERLDAEARAWLRNLPVTLEPAPGILAFHARPDDDNAYLIENVAHGGLVRAPAADIETRLAGRNAALVVCGHSHQPTALALGGGTVVVNPGSVGCPAYTDDDPPHVSETGSPHARYAIVTMDGRAVTAVEHVAVTYDWRTAAATAMTNGRPEWAAALSFGLARPA